MIYRYSKYEMLNISGPRRFPSREGEQSCDHLHRRDRRHRYQALRRADRRRPRGPEDPPRTPQPDGRIRSDHQRQGQRQFISQN